jgi:hypothetical protein
LEYHLDGTVSQSSGRLAKIIDTLNLTASVVALEAKTVVPELLGKGEYTELLDLYNTSQRERDITCGRARRFKICPASIAIQLAQREKHKELLVALGRKVREHRVLPPCATTAS